MSFWQHETLHILVTLIVAIFAYWRYRKISLVIIVCLVGLCLDIDHVFDYLLAHANLKQLATGEYFTTSGKVYVLLHAWEWLIIWWGFILFILPAIDKKPIHYDLAIVVTLAYLGHMLIDQFSYQTQPETYFITFRILYNFNLKEIFR